jgi:hypothetical protein
VELIGPYLIGCTLLVLAGVMKAARPDDTARALVRLMPTRFSALSHVRRMRTTIRIAATLEAGLGVVAVAVPRSVSAGLVAASYVAFAGVVAYARSRGGALASCGCFGTPDTPATLVHVVVDLALAIAATLLATSAPTEGTILTALGHQPFDGVPLLVISAVGVWLSYLTLSMLAALEAARRTVGVPEER